MGQFDTELFNKTVGDILYKNRARLGLSVNQVSKYIKCLTPFELGQVEKGKTSLPCYALYELLKFYKPTEQEISFFCYPQKIKEQFTQIN
nr:hypothetical protein HAGR004_41700 [Bdellovibrio sp. HAGR004]